MVSRVAKNPVMLPKGVEVKISDKLVTIKGKHGELKQVVHELVDVSHVDSSIVVAPSNSETASNALAGTVRALMKNMVQGVSEGFERKLVLVGVGYRAKAQGK